MSLKHNMLEIALMYKNKLGFSVFPCTKEKKSRVKWLEFQKRLPTDEEIIGWWTKWPDAMIGVATGKLSNLILMDADSEAAIDTYHEYFKKGIETPTVITGGKGYHFYFKWTDCKITSNNGWSENADAKGEGGYSILPPSVSYKGPYDYVEGRRFSEVERQEAPTALIKAIEEAAANRLKPSKKSPDAIGIQFSKGGRDDAVFSVANSLIKSGMDIQNVKATVRIVAAGCIPPFSPEEADIKVDSALRRAGTNEGEIKSRVRQWVDEASGTFRIEGMWNQLCFTHPDQKSLSRAVLRELCEEKVLASSGTHDGVYKKISIVLEKMRRVGEVSKEVEIWLPFGLHHKFVVRPGTLILVAGVSNAGKSAFFLNFTEMNKDNHDIRYVSSEWEAEERDAQLRDFGVDIDEWDERVDFYYKKDTEISFDNYIKPDGITLIDYYECYEEMFNAGRDMRNIADKLKTGVAIVGLQKHPSSTHGYGGAQTAFRSQLYINIDTNEDDPTKKIVSIVKLKKPRGDRRFNIEHLCCQFEYDEHGRICNQGQWGKMVEEKIKGQPPTKHIEPSRWANHTPLDSSSRPPLETDVTPKQVNMFNKSEGEPQDHADEELDGWGDE